MSFGKEKELLSFKVSYDPINNLSVMIQNINGFSSPIKSA
jgi:hypothetical protein